MLKLLSLILIALPLTLFAHDPGEDFAQRSRDDGYEEMLTEAFPAEDFSHISESTAYRSNLNMEPHYPQVFITNSTFFRADHQQNQYVGRVDVCRLEIRKVSEPTDSRGLDAISNPEETFGTFLNVTCYENVESGEKTFEGTAHLKN